ncbi:uncharacterized protein LOC114731806 [Neltuma alba]|uniref:uncharacterized protein LOC114731806 n=1 Tax=Neltuma alba TaxID=207710 RepID=UPI0010A44FB1|nr:uncharacterized protein LOC114731806 [Prosopis alba]
MEQWETRTSNLTSYVTKLSNGMSEQQAKASGSMSSNTVINPKSLNAITLRRGKEIGAKTVQFKDDEEGEEPVDKEIEVESAPSKTTQDILKTTQETSIQSKGPIEKGSSSKGDEVIQEWH